MYSQSARPSQKHVDIKNRINIVLTIIISINDVDTGIEQSGSTSRARTRELECGAPVGIPLHDSPPHKQNESLLTTK